jgi:hypothetical protein
MLLWGPLSFRSRPWLTQRHLPRQKPSRYSPKMPKTHPGRRFHNPSQVAAQLMAFIGTQISLRLMVVVLYQFPLAFRAVQFPTDTAQTLLFHRTRKSILSTTMGQASKSRPRPQPLPLLSRTPRRRQSRARSPRYPLPIQRSPQRLLIPRKVRT